MGIAMIGLDVARRVFQAHGVDASGKAVLRRKLGRGEVLGFFKGLSPCLVGIEACGTAHHWAREIRALGHEVKLMPASYVKPYVKRGKTDAADAEAICEAVRRPTMRFVPVKSVEQQAVLMLHRTRELLVRQRTMLVNALRGHMAELGIVAPQGIARVADLLVVLACSRTRKQAPACCQPPRIAPVQEWRSAIHSSPGRAPSSSGATTQRSLACASSQASMSTTRPLSGSCTTGECPGSAAPCKPRNAASRFSLAARWLPSSTRSRQAGWQVGPASQAQKPQAQKPQAQKPPAQKPPARAPAARRCRAQARAGWQARCG